jgi:hypothetical protein
MDELPINRMPQAQGDNLWEYCRHGRSEIEIALSGFDFNPYKSTMSWEFCR